MDTTNKEWADFQHTLRRYVARRVEAAHADDLVSEILLRLIQHESGFKTADNPLAWMYRVATNVITDYYRRRSAEHAMVENRDNAELVEVDHQENEITPQEELARCLIPLIKNLPPQYREALQLVDIEGLPQQKAARQLGLSLSGMKSRVQRGRIKLKELLLSCCAVELNKRGGVVDYADNSGCC